MVKQTQIDILCFTAKYCSPCKHVKEVCIPKLQEELDRSKVVSRLTKIDLSQYPFVARESGIRVVPTTIIVENEEEVMRLEGAFDWKAVADDLCNRQ